MPRKSTKKKIDEAAQLGEPRLRESEAGQGPEKKQKKKVAESPALARPDREEVKRTSLVEVKKPAAASHREGDDFVPEIPDFAETGGAGKDKKTDRYFEAVGRRKTAIARVRLFTRSGDFTINGKAYGEYFPTFMLQRIVEDAMQKMKLQGRFRISVAVHGGGIHAQAEAVRHGLSRCLTKFNPDFRKRLKRAGFLKRDPRARERKKFGLKKARRAPQWAKR